MTELIKIEGIGEVYAAKLQESGIITQADLLAQGAAPAGRKAIAKASGISPKLILKWLNRADLARVKGIGEEYADLLEYAGVDTVPELARRNPVNLYAKLKTVNEEKSLTRRLPSEAQVAQWVEQAKSLPRAIRY